MTEPKVDRQWCEEHAPDSHFSATSLEENLIGESVVEAVSILAWIDEEEFALRRKHGRAEGLKRFKPYGMLRNWARKNGKGGWG